METRAATSPIMSKKDICQTYRIGRTTLERYLAAGMLKPMPQPIGTKRKRFRRQDVESVFGKIA